MGLFGWDDPVGDFTSATTNVATGGLASYRPGSGFGPGVVSQGLGIGSQSSPGVDSSGRPMAPGYNSLLKGDAYNNLKDTINNKGMNPWSAMALSRQNKLGQKNIEEATDRVAGQNATTASKLAAGGGLTSGARERSAQSGQSDLLKMVQDINNKKDTNALQIGISDGDYKQKALTQLGGLEQADNQGQNDHTQNAYNEQMRAWAAEKQAQATANSGSKGLFGLGIGPL